jgi:hypothetical protein
MLYPDNEWKLVQFEKCNDGKKKVIAILENRNTKKRVNMKFGMKGSSTYQDKTGVGGDETHGDRKRRESYRSRHRGEGDTSRKWSPGYFSWWYLW